MAESYTKAIVNVAIICAVFQNIILSFAVVVFLFKEGSRPQFKNTIVVIGDSDIRFGLNKTRAIFPICGLICESNTFYTFAAMYYIQNTGKPSIMKKKLGRDHRIWQKGQNFDCVTSISTERRERVHTRQDKN